jgi:hypothetical protein
MKGQDKYLNTYAKSPLVSSKYHHGSDSIVDGKGIPIKKV